MSSTWRDVIAVHPVADVFPLLPAAELAELAKDIEQNGMRIKPIFWTDPIGKEWLLDGRNRLDAMEKVLGWPLVEDGHLHIIARAGRAPKGGGQLENVGNIDGADPVSTIIGVNINRRHLTKLQKARIIIEAVKAGQAWRTDMTESVRSVPRKPNGTVNGSTPDPLNQEILRQAAKAGISDQTVRDARAQERRGKDGRRIGARANGFDREVMERTAKAGISRPTTTRALRLSRGQSLAPHTAAQRVVADIDAMLHPSRTTLGQRLDEFFATNPSPADRQKVAQAFARLEGRVQALAAKVQPAGEQVAS